jgi:DNA replication protein DnaC
VLILDDLGAQSSTPWAQEKLFQILNYRYNAKLATVITSNLTLDDHEARLRSRMLDPAICNYLLIQASPYRLESGTRPSGPKRSGRPRPAR